MKTSPVIRAVYCGDSTTAAIMSIPHTLEAMQKVVGGDIEPIEFFSQPGTLFGKYVAFCREDSTGLPLIPLNRVLDGTYEVYGPFIVLKNLAEADEEEGLGLMARGLTEEEAHEVFNLFLQETDK